MQNRMRGLLIVFAAGFLFIVIPVLFVSLHNAPISYHVQNVAGVSTASDIYAANVTLDIALYQGSVLNVESCTSNISGDSPSASYYNAVSKRLEISGLEQDSQRTLSVEYGVASDITNDLPSLSPILVTIAWLFIFAGIALVVAGILIVFGVL